MKKEFKKYKDSVRDLIVLLMIIIIFFNCFNKIFIMDINEEKKIQDASLTAFKSVIDYKQMKFVEKRNKLFAFLKAKEEFEGLEDPIQKNNRLEVIDSQLELTNDVLRLFNKFFNT